MKKLKAHQMDRLLIDGLFKIGDLVNYEGPLMSLFSTNKEDLYIYDWADCDDNFHRWLIYQVTPEQLINYLNGNLTHYQLIMSHSVVFAVDLDSDAKPYNITLLPTTNIPNDYLPDIDVLHEDEDCPHLDKIKGYLKSLASKAKKTQITDFKNQI
jgi:hypothetical protein